MTFFFKITAPQSDAVHAITAHIYTKANVQIFWQKMYFNTLKLLKFDHKCNVQ